MNRRISDKDKKDWENFLDNNENLPNKDVEFIHKNEKKILSFDLHGFSLDEANKKVEELIINAFVKNITKLIIVTGKGLHSKNKKNPYVSKDLGILKYSVPEFIENNIELKKIIIEIKDAEIKDGGAGAFYIFLKKKKL